MGCGQSKIGIYQRKSKNKKNGNKRTGEGGESEEETEEAEDRIESDAKNETEDNEGESVPDSVTSKIKQMAQQQQQQQAGGAILAQSDISSSQLDFFKMLDEKIENGPDYEGDDEEEERARLAGLLEEWRAASMTRQQRKNGLVQEQDTWPSPSRGVTYAEDYGPHTMRGTTTLDTQRFPTGYSPCPPNAGIGIHLQNTFRAMVPRYPDQSRIQPLLQYPHHPYQPEPLCENASGHPLSTNEPPNPLRPNYSQAVMRHSAMNSHHYTENQRMYPGQYPDSPRTYVEQRQYALPRVMPTVNVLHEQRMYVQDGRPYPERLYQDGRQNIIVSYQDSQTVGTPRLLPDNQRLYHDRLMEGQRQYSESARQADGQRHVSFQRPPLLPQRSFQEPPRIYRDFDGEEQCFPRQERFEQEASSVRVPGYKTGRSASVDVQYVSGPPPPREIIPLQGGPGPPQGSPRPVSARGTQMNMHRLPPNPVVQFRKSRGAFAEPS